MKHAVFKNGRIYGSPLQCGDRKVALASEALPGRSMRSSHQSLRADRIEAVATPGAVGDLDEPVARLRIGVGDGSLLTTRTVLIVRAFQMFSLDNAFKSPGWSLLSM